MEGAWAGGFNTYFKERKETKEGTSFADMDPLTKIEASLEHFTNDQHIEHAAGLMHQALLQASQPGGILHKAKLSQGSLSQVASNASSETSFFPIPFLPEVSTSTTSVPCIGLVIETTTVGAVGSGTGVGMGSISIGGTTLLTGQMATVSGVGGLTVQTIGGGSLVLPYATMSALSSIAGTTVSVCGALGINGGTVMAVASVGIR
jgi:hypothetical protein